MTYLYRATFRPNHLPYHSPEVSFGVFPVRASCGVPQGTLRSDVLVEGVVVARQVAGVGVVRRAAAARRLQPHTRVVVGQNVVVTVLGVVAVRSVCGA